ncbi:MAG TPA: CCA tRNA nucleotidyltransferase [Gemmatimonadales bacterium]|nr:CCA tRNA nucleotidyltransferase [Gemmatimonadales bacterium]
MTFPRLSDIPEEVLEIARSLAAAGYEVWCVGGALRDHLLGNPHTDYDLATSARPEDVQRLFRRTAAIGIRHGTVGVIDRRRIMHEVTTFRRDVSTDGRHAVVEYGVSLDDDLARRDFTINALAYHPLRGEWRDPFDGAGDLAQGVVRAVGDPAERFREDYLRILRALRFAARFGFTIHPDTWAAALEAVEGLRRLSAERVHDEWFKGLDTARDPAELVRLWRASGAAGIWLPELEEPAASAEAAAQPRDPARLTVLYTSDPVAVLRRLRSSNEEIGRATAMVAGPAAPEGAGEMEARRWLARVGDAADDLIAMHRLGQGAEPAWAEGVLRVRQRGDPVSRAQLAIGGGELQSLGVTGPRIGELLAALLERVLDDPRLNTRDTLLALAREMV